MIKKIVLILTAILTIGLCIFIYKNDQIETQREAEDDRIETEIRPFSNEIAKTEQEMVELDKAYELAIKPHATTQVIFTGLEEEVYTTCYPIMQEFGYTGILALSWSQVPGAEGCMSIEHFQELIDAGWNICIKWDSDTPLETWWPKLQEQLAILKMEMGQVVYFTTGNYSGELDVKLQELGFTIVIHHGEEAESLIQLADEEGVWHLGAVGLVGEKPKLRLTEAISQQGNIAYLVGFELEDERYDERSFRSMLSYFKTYENNEELVVLSAEEAREQYRARTTPDKQLEENYKKERAILEEKIRSLEAEIENIKAPEE